MHCHDNNFICKIHTDRKYEEEESLNLGFDVEEQQMMLSKSV